MQMYSFQTTPWNRLPQCRCLFCCTYYRISLVFLLPTMHYVLLKISPLTPRPQRRQLLDCYETNYIVYIFPLAVYLPASGSHPPPFSLSSPPAFLFPLFHSHCCSYSSPLLTLFTTWLFLVLNSVIIPDIFPRCLLPTSSTLPLVILSFNRVT